MEPTEIDLPNPYATPEDLRYAKVLALGVKVGFVLLVLSFCIYMTGLLPPFIPFDELPKYWGLSASEFAHATHMPTGWGWLHLVGKGDVLNLVAIAYLAGLSAVCSLAVLPMFVRRRDVVHAVILVLQVVVLVLAASNVLVA